MNKDANISKDYKLEDAQFIAISYGFASQLLSEIKTLRTEVLNLKEQLSPEVEPETKYISPAQAGRLIGKDPSTIHRWCKDGKLKKHGEGGARGKSFIEVAELLQLINKNEGE